MKNRLLASACALAFVAMFTGLAVEHEQTPTSASPTTTTMTVDTVPDFTAALVAADAVQRQMEADAYLQDLHRQEVARADAARERARIAQERARRPRARVASVSSSGNINGHPCGGNLPPCWVLDRETGGTGSPTSYNPTGCYESPAHSKDGRAHRGCKGKWQCSYSTCAGTGTEEQQDSEAAALWDGGKGCHHWAAC